MKNLINSEDLLVLLYWIRTDNIINGDTFKYTNLLDQLETYRLNNTPLNTNIHKIDYLMIDSFKMYEKLQFVMSKIDNSIFNDSIFKGLNIDIPNTINEFKNIFESILETCKFELPEIRGIQKTFLIKKMNDFVNDENYENAALIRDLIKEC